MSRNFEFNAPQYINFSNLDDSEADSFFDTAVEPKSGTNNLIIKNSPKLKDLSHEKLNEENREQNSTLKSGSAKKGYPILRKVLHEIVNYQIQTDNTPSAKESSTKKSEKELLQKFENLHVSESQPKNVNSLTTTNELLKSGRKSHCMITRLDVINKRVEPSAPLPVDSCAEKDILDCQSTKKGNCNPPRETFIKMKRTTSPLASTRKFISLAEQIEHFHKDTPDRYRSKPNKKSSMTSSWSNKFHASIPKTPKLITKFRQRKIDFPNEKQREEMELEEMKRHQIKAYPLNEKIFMGPSLNLKAPIIRKPATIPQPFSLTEVKKKEALPDAVFHFKAQPLPSAILQGPVGIPAKKITAPTIPTTPQIRVPLRFRVGVKTPEKTSESDGLNPPRNTKVQPFSFDARMKETLHKKEEFIKKVIEEEKKSFSSFRAHPMPSFKSKCDGSFKSEKSHATTPRPFNLSQPKQEKLLPEQEFNVQRVTPFKARPATIVHQKPFIPKLQKHEVIHTADFHLKTEKRALERQKFDERLKQKEEELTLALKIQKEEEEKLERERALRDRKKAEFKAKPMPKYKAFEIHAADPMKLTTPQSPRFRSKERNLKKVNGIEESC